MGQSVRALSNAARQHRRRESGQTTVEYAAIVGFFAVLLIAAIVAFRGGVSEAFDRDSGAVGAYKPPVALCDQNYSGGCVPPYPPDIGCGDLPPGPPIAVEDDDPHGLDPDDDGVACN